MEKQTRAEFEASLTEEQLKKFTGNAPKGRPRVNWRPTGKVTLPIKLWKSLGLTPGVRLQVIIQEDGIYICPL